MRRRRTAVLLSVVFLGLGCVSRWTPRTVEPTAHLQWPFAPAPPKVTFVRSLSGFTPHRSTPSRLKSILVGEAKEDDGTFVLPVAVATGPDGRVAVADAGRRCVHLYLPAERRYVRIEGSRGERIQSPVGVIFDDASRLYLSDSAGAVFAFDREGGFLFAVRKVGGQDLKRPTGLAYSPSRKLLYVVDTLAHTIHALDASGAEVFSFGRRGVEEGCFNFPTHIFRSSAGELYVADSLNFRIAIFDEAGQPRGSFGHHGDGSGDIAMPKGLAVDRDGIVYAVDGLFDNVQLFSRRGDFLLTVGRRGTEAGEFWLPSGAFLSESDELYVCDTYNRRVQVFRIAERYDETAS